MLSFYQVGSVVGFGLFLEIVILNLLFVYLTARLYYKKLTPEPLIFLSLKASRQLPLKTYTSNMGADKLIIIEIQTGAYLGEDDIIRFDDIYGRFVKPRESISNEY